MISPDPLELLNDTLQSHAGVLKNPPRGAVIQDVVDRKEAFVSATGALATWNAPASTGRRPENTYIVEHPASREHIDWTSPNSHPISVGVFDALWQDALMRLAGERRLYVMDRVIGADPSYALSTRVVTDRALTALFCDTMFRPAQHGLAAPSGTPREGFTLLVLPFEKAQAPAPSPIVIAMDMDRRLGLVMGSSYCGTVKKLMFTVMNYLLPEQGILPLHSAATEGAGGDVVVMLGLSGTGKTTLSADPERTLIGDDEHAWSQDGIANFEFGCYAKLIDLDPSREPEVHHAVFGPRPVPENGVIIENAFMFADGTFDLSDRRLTENSRASYPLTYLRRTKADARATHPKIMLFLTADAHGVLPPIARLTPDQAALWFLMGYTSKLAGTETGVVEPKSAFSRFFGQPFMPRVPEDYTKLFQQYTKQHETPVYLVNTGWSGGPYGVGKRMDINLTRSIVKATISGELARVSYREDKRFHVSVPESCPGIDATLLDPKQTWTDPIAYDARADALAHEFSSFFDRTFASRVRDPLVVAQCPGK